jgi:four helix bundle suffix protein
MTANGFLPPHGNYRELLSYQKAEVVYDLTYLLDQQIRRLEQDFLKEGGLRERMTRARLAARKHQSHQPCPSH